MFFRTNSLFFLFQKNLCSAYSTCETYDLSEIRKYFSNKVYAPECNTAYTLANLPKGKVVLFFVINKISV